uniref:EGF-like domain-containing protein n=1 Tax=Steinernema glaseri TaxID=37863 RepID=A0A1I7XX34_9BILA
MAERDAHLASIILFSLLLSTTAIVPASNECWDDRIFAFSGSLHICNATKRCANETALLNAATEECGQPPKNHTFHESCGVGHYFGIDYTCCAPYQYHDHCLDPRRWDQDHTDVLVAVVKEYTRLEKSKQEALRRGDNATADIIEEQQLNSKFRSPFPGGLRPLRDKTCTNKTEATVSAGNSFISRHNTYYEYRAFALRHVLDIPSAVKRFLTMEYNCTGFMPHAEAANPKKVYKMSYSETGGCYFFPELDREAVPLSEEKQQRIQSIHKH